MNQVFIIKIDYEEKKFANIRHDKIREKSYINIIIKNIIL